MYVYIYMYICIYIYIYCGRYDISMVRFGNQLMTGAPFPVRTANSWALETMFQSTNHHLLQCSA